MKELFADLVRDAEDTDEKTMVLCTMMLCCACMFMFAVNVITNSTVMIAITGALAVWSLLNCVVYKKIHSMMILSVNILSAILVMMMYFVVSGGEDGFSIVWLLMAPPLGIFFFKLLYGGSFSVILGLLTTIYLWSPLHELGYPYSDTYLLRFPIVYTIELLVCIYINYTILLYRKRQVTLLEMAQQASSTKSDFLANMSHEIRTPLNAVVGMCELVLRERDISDTVRDYCFNIQNSGRSLLSIINDILDFSKIESGKMEIINEPFNITSTVNDVINMAITRKGSKPIEIIVNCDPNIPAGLIGDELRIRQVMINLVTNAMKFTEKGCVAVKISMTGHDYGINLSFSVSDTGIGISEENLENLFNSFQQVNTKKNRAVEGTGLGLAISRKFIKSMGGFINVSSVSGEGSEFRFVIPLEVSDPAPCISLKNSDGIKAACFIDMSKFEVPRVEKEYTKLINEMAVYFNADITMMRSFGELERALEEKSFTHVFAAREEYAEYSTFFNRLAEKTKVVIVQERINSIDIPENMKCIYKPFYVLNIASVFNNENLLGNVNERRNTSIRFTAPKARVLIVDDNAINLKVAAGLMRPYHMQVVTADSGSAAISLLRSKDFDIVFMDHMMPEMDGIEATKAIRSMEGDYYKKLPIIALTANAVNGVRDVYIAEGLNDFIAKPIELGALDRVLKAWLPSELIQAPERSVEYTGKKRRKTDMQKNDNAVQSELFSTETGIFYTGGDAEAYNEILEMYVRKAQEKHDHIQSLFEEKSWKNYIIEVHALKSSSLTIGSKKLSDLAKELELAGKAGNFSLIEEKNAELMEMYLNVAKIGREYLKMDEKAEKAESAETSDGSEAVILTEMTSEQLDELIEKLKNACESFDGDEVSAVCTEHGGFSFGGRALRPLLDEIKSEADDFEYDSAAEKASALKDKLSA